MLSVGKSNALIQVLPSALRFWTKLGLRPRGGNKDVTAFVLFEGSSEAREEQAAEWLESVSRAYEVCFIDRCGLPETDLHPGQKLRETYIRLCCRLH